ncbi:hypothetical protein HOD61_01990 [archaeon]|jgi:hypothetical protein|nr:hypothetical protein [archaeon]
MNRRAELTWDQIGIFLLAIILLVILIVITWQHKGTLANLFIDFKTVFRFGGG